MNDRESDDSESRFAAYVEGLVSVIGHADRAKPLRDYCTGLMLPCERKSVEPMAAVTEPVRVALSTSRCCTLLLKGAGRTSWF
jgi:SRSO17 transposase